MLELFRLIQEVHQTVQVAQREDFQIIPILPNANVVRKARTCQLEVKVLVKVVLLVNMLMHLVLPIATIVRLVKEHQPKG